MSFKAVESDTDLWTNREIPVGKVVSGHVLDLDDGRIGTGVVVHSNEDSVLTDNEVG